MAEIKLPVTITFVNLKHIDITNGDANIVMLNEHIRNYIDNDLSELALEINSPWGSGKTYSVNQYIKNDEEDKNTWVSVSVNGVQADEIEELFISSFIQSLDTSTSGVIAKSTNFITKFIPDSQSVGPVSINLPISSLRNKIVENYITKRNDRTKQNESLKKLVFVIDDVERIQNVNALKKLFGIVSVFLQEQLHAHAIILVNEDQLGKDEKSFFLENREKIINQVVTVTKRKNDVIAELMDDAITTQDASIIQSLTSNLTRITQENGSDNVNYRTLKVFISDINLILHYLNKNEGYNAFTDAQKKVFWYELTQAVFTILVAFREKSVDFTNSKPSFDELDSLRYLTLNNIQAITQFVAHGTTLDTQQLVDDFSRRYSLFTSNVSLDKLRNFRELSQEDLSTAQNELASNGTFTDALSKVPDLIAFFNLIDFLHEKNFGYPPTTIMTL